MDSDIRGVLTSPGSASTVQLSLHRRTIEAKLRESDALAYAPNSPFLSSHVLNRVWMSPKGTNVVYFDGTINYARPNLRVVPMVGMYRPDTGGLIAVEGSSHDALHENF